MDSLFSNIELFLKGFVSGATEAAGGTLGGSAICTASIQSSITKVFALRQYSKLWLFSEIMKLNIAYEESLAELNKAYTYCNFNNYLNSLNLLISGDSANETTS